MGTRGLYGFRYKGKYYLVYNHYDSYYSHLGNILLKEIKLMILENKFNEWIEKFKKLNFKLNDEESIEEENIYVQQQSFELLLNTNKIIIIEEIYKFDHGIDAEYIYVCNFDRKRFEIYNGIIKEKEYYIKIPDNLEDDIDEY
jgi:hypothetical protein